MKNLESARLAFLQADQAEWENMREEARRQDQEDLVQK
jgi:hypothetical protein